MTYELLDHNNSLLRGKAASVIIRSDHTFDEGIVEMCGRLMETMKKNNGFGIAAPQVGIPLRIIIVKDEVMINPEYDTIRIEDEVIDSEEGCLSIPGIRATVKRHKKVAVSFYKPDGTSVLTTLDGDRSRCFQHEMDHLDGILFPDYLSRFKQQRAIDAAKKRGFDYAIKDFPNSAIPF